MDEGNIDDYRRRALEAFIYRRRGRPVALSFRQAPEEALDDEELLCQWAQRALEAARRAGKAARKRNAGSAAEGKTAAGGKGAARGAAKSETASSDAPAGSAGDKPAGRGGKRAAGGKAASKPVPARKSGASKRTASRKAS